MTIAYISHPACEHHDMGMSHPERPARLRAIEGHLKAVGLYASLRVIMARRAEQKDLLRVHTADYVESIFTLSPNSGHVQLDADTCMSPGSLEAALHAAGAGIQAVELVMKGELTRAFCAVRPPGHHAERERAMGFCLFNNVAVAAAYALEVHGLQRVAILDFDVHHGNGTENIFLADPRVLYCSTFQHPFYPGTQPPTTAEHIVYSPLPASSGTTEFRHAIEADWLPALERFKPQLVLVSAGFDAHAEDPLGGLFLDESDFSWVTQQICEIAGCYAQGWVVSMLEGGYNLSVLARSVAAHISALLEDDLSG